MLNEIFIMGRLTRDPELRHTQSGTPVVSFTLAVDRDYRGKNTGEKSTDFIPVVAWNQTAEFISKYCAKGRLIVVDGRLQIRDWTDTDGCKRRSTEVLLSRFYFSDSKKREDDDTKKDNNTYDSGEASPEMNFDDRNLPF